MVSQSFRDRADKAAFTEAWVGAVLSRMGLYTLHYPFEIDDGKDHSQTFDLTVSSDDPLNIDCWGESACEQVDVEIKGLSLTFTCPEDYPFKDVLVCSQNNFLRKWPGSSRVGRDFLLVSCTGHIVWLPKRTEITLNHNVLDKTRNELYQAVRANKADLKTVKEFVVYVKS